MSSSYGGLGSKGFADNAQVSGGAAGVGRTFLDTTLTNRCLQNGTISSVKYFAHDTVPNGMKIKVFRQNGSNWDFVGESEKFTPVAGSTQTRTLSTPITGVAPGDVFGVWIDIDGPATINVGALTSGAGPVVWTSGDNVGASQTFGNTLANLTLPLEVFGAAPVAAMTGDSIEAGHGSNYASFMDGTGPAGDISAELGFRLRAVIGGSFTYQDYAAGSKDWSWVRLTALPAILAGTGVHASGPLGMSEIWIHCGVNDVAGGRSWADVEADLDAIYAGTSVPLFIDEILPDTNFIDTLAAAVRTFNANYGAWAVGKSRVRIVACWSALGQTRISTGLKDDLKSSYDSGDGVHLNATGAAALAVLRKTARNGYYGIGVNNRVQMSLGGNRLSLG